MNKEKLINDFTREFELLNCTLRYNKDSDSFSVHVNVKLDYSFNIEKDNGIAVYGVHHFVYVPYNIQVLSLSLQQEFWGKH